MTIENTMERIADALERIAQASEGKLLGSTTATLEDHPAAPKTKTETKPEVEEPKKRAVKRKPEPEPEPEEEFEDLGEEEPDEAPKPTGKVIKFVEVRTAFFKILNDVRAVKEHGALVARDVGGLLLKEFCGGSKTLTEESIEPAQYQAFINRVEELHDKYCG